MGLRILVVMKLRYDPAADAIYIYLSKKRRVSPTREMHSEHSMRLVDYDKEGNVIGIEILGTKQGIDVEGLPQEEDVAALLQAHGFQVLTHQ